MTFEIKFKKISIFILSLFLFFTFFSGYAWAGTEANTTGWLWGGSQDGDDGSFTGLGWVSLNSVNCDTDGNGFKDVFCLGDNTTTAIVNYGVNFPLDGTLASGYAWSGNMGWISFNSSDLSGCPSGACEAKISGEELVGWARIVGVCDTGNAANSYAKDGKCDVNDDGTNSGGWSGFINLKGIGYGIRVGSISGVLEGYGWNGENIDDPIVTLANMANGFGWLKPFGARISSSVIPSTPFLSICQDSCMGSEIFGSVTLLEGNTKNLRACFGVLGCDSADPSSDVTSSAIYTELNSPDDAVSLSGSVVTANNKDKKEDVTIEYMTDQLTINFSVYSSIPKQCYKCENHNCSSTEVFGPCQGAYPLDSQSKCEAVCSYGNWKEVHPENE